MSLGKSLPIQIPPTDVVETCMSAAPLARQKSTHRCAPPVFTSSISVPLEKCLTFAAQLKTVLIDRSAVRPLSLLDRVAVRPLTLLEKSLVTSP